MNKGLFAHIVATIIGIVSAMYIIQEELLDMAQRVGVVALLLTINIFTSMAASTYDWYDQKL